jgi:multidrug efflux pump subunit AcrA (membrane-fusion protein)
LYGRDDPKVALLKAELDLANSNIEKLQAQKGELEAKIKLLELQLSKDPKVIEARRLQTLNELRREIYERDARARAQKEQGLKERDERERNNPELKRERERREQKDREFTAKIERENRRNGVTPPFGGQSWV